MQVYGILGWPIGHSLSPAMHRAAFEALGIDASYVPFAVRPDRLADAIAGARALGLAGFNVTVPHKEAVLALLDDVEPDARAIGAVNTVVREGERLVGLNTDAPGFTRALAAAGFEPRGTRCVVLGAGGAARAAVVGLERAGAAQITIAARRPDRARHIADDVQSPGGIAIETCGLEDLERAFTSADLVVQATNATLDGNADAEPFVDALPLDALPAHATVNDLVYAPRETTLIEAARSRGLPTVDGLGMLLYQGALAFERWTGKPAPIEPMRRALGHI